MTIVMWVKLRALIGEQADDVVEPRLLLDEPAQQVAQRDGVAAGQRCDREKPMCPPSSPPYQPVIVFQSRFGTPP